MSSQRIATGDRLALHYEKVVRELVARHAKMHEEPLVLAIRFRFDDPEDIHLLEVIEGFPGGDDDPLLTTEFGPTPEFPILGRFHLTLSSPAQLRSAIGRSDEILTDLRRDGIVLFPQPPDSTAKQLLSGLGLPA